MKWMIVLLLFASTAYGQLSVQYVRDTTISTSWVVTQKATNQRITQFEVINDNAFSSTDTLYVAFNADTTAARVFKVLPGESAFYPSVTLSTLRLKAGSGTVKIRLRYY